MASQTMIQSVMRTHSTTSTWLKWMVMVGLYGLVIISFFSQVGVVRTPFDTGDPASLVQRAIAYEAYGEYNNAVLDYQAAIALDATFAPAYLHLAQLYDRWQAWDDAIVMYRLYLDYASVPDTMVMARLDVLQ